MNNKLFFTLVISGSILMIALLFFQNQSVWAEELREENPGTNVVQTTIDQLKSLVNSSNSDNAQSNLDGKIQAMEYKQSVQATAQAAPDKSLEEICKAIAADQSVSVKKAQPERQTGILSVREDFLAPQGYLIQNMWRGAYDGYDVEIYAGSFTQDIGNGVVIVSIPQLDLFKVFPDPQPDGALTITQMENDLLQMTTANGNTREFDLPAQQFTNDLSKSMAVVDLPIAPTPIPDPCAVYTSP